MVTPVASLDGRGRFDVTVVSPPAQSGPAIVFIPAVFGVSADVMHELDAYAARGFFVLAPDLFWRIDPGPLGYDGSDRDRAFARYAGFDVASGVEDLDATIRLARSLPGANGRVAVLGVCFGGRLAFLAGTRLGVDAIGAFHGTKIGMHLDEADRLICPASLHFGEDDAQVPLDEVAAIRTALSSNANAHVYTYPGAKHGFSHPTRPSYDERAASASAARVLDAFGQLH